MMAGRGEVVKAGGLGGIPAGEAGGDPRKQCAAPARGEREAGATRARARAAPQSFRSSFAGGTFRSPVRRSGAPRARPLGSALGRVAVASPALATHVRRAS